MSRGIVWEGTTVSYSQPLQEPGRTLTRTWNDQFSSMQEGLQAPARVLQSEARRDSTEHHVTDSLSQGISDNNPDNILDRTC